MIEVTDLRKTYFNTATALEVLKGISITIKPKEIVSIVGPSGAGKSTLLHILGGLDTPTQGRVTLDGEDIHKFNDGRLAKIRNGKIGFVFQFYHLLPEFTALENVILPALIKEDQKKNFGFKAFPELSLMENLLVPFSINYKKRVSILKEKATVLMEKFGLAGRLEHKPHQLSGGEQQRVSIVRALINEPKVILCDEPTGNLDSENGRQIIETIVDLNKKNGQTFVIVTHDEGIARLSHRVIHLKDGKINSLS